MLLLLGLTHHAQAQCSGTKLDECFDFNFKGAALNSSNGTVTISFGVRVTCSHDLSHASFELPSGAKALSATGPSGYENGTNNPFYSIKFNLGSGYKNGRTADFSYTVAAADYNRMTSLRAEAKASTTVGEVSFDLSGCKTSGGGGGGGNDGGGTGGGDCSSSHPRPMEGPSKPCPGEIVEYSVANEYTSYDWEVPRAKAGEPPLGWEIVSGQNSNKVKVRVGMKSGTMKVTVNHAECGTKVATMPVNPGKGIAVSISGGAAFCPGDIMVFKASGNKVNGRNNSHDMVWGVPAGWTIVSGQGTGTLIVRAGATAGNVSLMLASNPTKNKELCEAGEAVLALTLKPSCSPCAKPPLNVDAPEVVCASGSKIYTFSVDNRDPKGKVKYQFFLPDEFIKVSEGYGYVNIRVNNAKPDSTLFVTVVAVNGNNCGAEAVCLPVRVENCPTGPCTPPVVALVVPERICNIGDPVTFSVQNPQAGVTYEFNVPEGFIILEEGADYVTVLAALEEGQVGPAQVFRVIATNNCTSAIAERTVTVIECEPGNPLPVTLTRFVGVSRNGAVELAWNTASEKDNDRFEVERSTNGKDFVKVGQVKGNGNSTALVAYAYTDRTAASGTVYYRLRQVDFNNAFEYSKVISVNHTATGKAGAMSVFPNPVTDGSLSIRLPEVANGNAIIRLVDMNGKVVHSREVSNAGAEMGMELKNVRAGMYLLSVTVNGRSTTQRIMVR